MVTVVCVSRNMRDIFSHVRLTTRVENNNNIGRFRLREKKYLNKYLEFVLSRYNARRVGMTRDNLAFLRSQPVNIVGTLRDFGPVIRNEVQSSGKRY